MNSNYYYISLGLEPWPVNHYHEHWIGINGPLLREWKCFIKQMATRDGTSQNRTLTRHHNTLNS